jgi:hypothetical protein
MTGTQGPDFGPPIGGGLTDESSVADSRNGTSGRDNVRDETAGSKEPEVVEETHVSHDTPGSSEGPTVLSAESIPVRHSFVDRVKTAFRRPGFGANTLSIGAVLIGGVALLIIIGSMKLTTFGVLVLIALCGFVFFRLVKQSYDPPREVPTETVLPTEGIPKLLYWVNCRYGRPDKVPHINRKQRAKEDARLAREEEEYLQHVNAAFKQRVIDLYHRGVMPTFWIGHSGGNTANTTMSITVASLLGDLLPGIKVGVLPNMANTQTGTAAMLAGLEGRTITLRKYHELITAGKVPTPRALFQLLHGTQHGVYVVSEDPDDENVDQYFLAGRWTTVYDHFYPSVEILVEDSGNDGSHKGSVTNAGIIRAHVVIYSCYVGNPKQIKRLPGVIGGYWASAQRGAGVGKANTNQRELAEDIPLSEKVQHSAVVFHGVDPKGDLQQYADYATIGKNGVAPHKGRIGYVRYDDYLRHVTEDFDPGQMSPATQLDYWVIIAERFEECGRVMGVEIPERDPIILNYSGLSASVQD